MRLCKDIFKQIEAYSKFNPSPLSIKKFIDFGEYTDPASIGERGGEREVSAEPVFLGHLWLENRPTVYCGSGCRLNFLPGRQ